MNEYIANQDYWGRIMEGYVPLPDDDKGTHYGWGSPGGELHPMYGQTHTEHSKELMRQVDRSYTQTEEFSKIMSEVTRKSWDKRGRSNKWKYTKSDFETPRDWHSKGPTNR